MKTFIKTFVLASSVVYSTGVFSLNTNSLNIYNSTGSSVNYDISLIAVGEQFPQSYESSNFQGNRELPIPNQIRNLSGDIRIFAGDTETDCQCYFLANDNVQPYTGSISVTVNEDGSCTSTPNYCQTQQGKK